MLIYNFEKKFLGIDKDDLESLGFSTLAQLQEESGDFANLFVKSPGYIHNFAHIHWIDFLLCAEKEDETKVIIHANKKNYTSTLKIKTAYLVDSPAKEAYIIKLSNLKELTDEQSHQIATDLEERVAPQPATQERQTLNIPKTSTEQTITPSSQIIKKEIEETIESKEFAPIDISFDDSDEITLISQSVDKKTQDLKEDELKLSTYVFDPHIASEDLGLPLDLIDEFIEDFITQASEFKEGLFTALDTGNLNQVKSLSHKLKGVAANLRIEDAKETLIIINTSSDINKIKANLILFYKIIDKLKKNKPSPHQEDSTKQNSEKEESIFGYDKNIVAKEIGLDKESFNEVFDDFIEEAKTTLNTISFHIENNDIQEWQKTALYLRTISENMRIDIYNKELENLLKTEDIISAKESLNKIKSIILKIEN